MIFKMEIDDKIYSIDINAKFRSGEPPAMSLIGTCLQLDEVFVVDCTTIDECLFLTCAAVAVAIVAREAGE